jgi:hypothetical protein
MANTIQVDVVSAEESIFSGEADFVVLPGETGELGIYPRHTPLITRIKPGSVRIQPAGGGDEQLHMANARPPRDNPGGRSATRRQHYAGAGRHVAACM